MRTAVAPLSANVTPLTLIAPAELLVIAPVEAPETSVAGGAFGAGVPSPPPTPQAANSVAAAASQQVF
jgi:hypothetical protein